MKKSFFIAALVLSMPLFSIAAESAMDQINQLHDGVCKEHKNPDLCKRVVGILMKGVKQNDDIYIECSKNKPSTPEDAMLCQDAKEVREKIASYN